MADPRSKELNMLDGPILPRILQFTLPLAATGMLQLLFNAADVIVVGKFSGSIALPAVGVAVKGKTCAELIFADIFL